MTTYVYSFFDQVYEPEVLIPLSLSDKTTKVVLAGDNMQVSLGCRGNCYGNEVVVVTWLL